MQVSLHGQKLAKVPYVRTVEKDSHEIKSQRKGLAVELLNNILHRKQTFPSILGTYASS